MFFSQWEFWRPLGPTGTCGAGKSLLCQEWKLCGSLTKRYRGRLQWFDKIELKQE